MSAITFCTGVDTVTGANFLFEIPNGRKIIIDCGLIQGEKFATLENQKPFPYDCSSIIALFVTHAHLDHIGRIPKLVKDGFRGTIFSTSETKALAELVLNDAVNILREESERDGIDPIYDMDDVKAIFPLWKTVDYHQNISEVEGVSVLFKDAGHILGSAMIEVTVEGQSKFLFTGDLGNSPSPLLCDTESIGGAEYLIMESVYGDRNHEDREGRTNHFGKIILDSQKRGGTLVIPAFSVDRTQTLLYELNNMVENNKIPSIPVFLDSPMAIKATAIYASGRDLYNNRVKDQIAHGDDIFKFPRLEYSVSGSDSINIGDTKEAKIIIAGSGMSVGGRVLSHEIRYLPDQKNTILLIGYQTPGSLGRQLADGAKEVRIHGQTIKVKAKIETLYGYSAHKDMDRLVDFVATAEKLKKVFVVMGEPRASMHLAQRINDEFGLDAIVPERNREYKLT